MFKVLLGLDFSHQPSAGLRATKQRCPEKAGTILRASSKFHGRRWFRLSAVEVECNFPCGKERLLTPTKSFAL